VLSDHETVLYSSVLFVIVGLSFRRTPKCRKSKVPNQ